MEILAVFALLVGAWLTLDYAADFFVAWRREAEGARILRDAVTREDAVADLAHVWQAEGMADPLTYARGEDAAAPWVDAWLTADDRRVWRG